MNLNTRPPLDPYEGAFFVLCSDIIVAGLSLKFGDQIPDYTDLFHLHTHFDNGVVGTKRELESLLGNPLELYQDDPLMPIAMFVAQPHKVKDPISQDEERGEFHLENAKLLTKKKDVQAFAKDFGIDLEISPQIKLATMLETLETLAKEKGLIKEENT